MSGKFFSKFDFEYFSFFIFLKYLLLLLLIMIYVPKMTLLEKSKICRTFRAVGHLGTLQTLSMKTYSKVLSPRVYAQTQELCCLESEKKFITSGPGVRSRVRASLEKRMNYQILFTLHCYGR